MLINVAVGVYWDLISPSLERFLVYEPYYCFLYF